MQWYYAEQGRQVGPLDEAALDNLVIAGIVRDDTLVWREGMATWATHASIRGPRAGASRSGIIQPAAPLLGSTQVCGECGKPFWIGDLVPIGPAYICAVCKPIYLQRMREGGGQALGAFHYAGFWIRFVAKVIDGVLLTMVRFALLMPLGLTVAPPVGGNPGQALAAAMRLASLSGLLTLGLSLAYEVYFLSTRGATIGKMVLGLKVVRADGGKISPGLAAGRYFATLVSEFTLLIGFIVAGFDAQKRALHDRMCDTRVIYANEVMTQLVLTQPRA